MAMLRFEPFRDLLALQDQMARAFDDRYWRRNGVAEEALSSFYPAVDVYEDQEGLTLTAEIPGVDPKSVDLRIENHTLTLSGERKLDREDKRENYLRVERAYGSFSRTFSLPPTVDGERVVAEYKNGLLKVFLPKKESSKPRQIKVSVTE